MDPICRYPYMSLPTMRYPIHVYICFCRHLHDSGFQLFIIINLWQGICFYNFLQFGWAIFFTLNCQTMLLDGTTNFAHGYPSFAVSVGVLFQGNPAAAAVVIITSVLFWIFHNFSYEVEWHINFYFQVEFVGGPMCWNTRIFSATAGMDISNCTYSFFLNKKIILC